MASSAIVIEVHELMFRWPAARAPCLDIPQFSIAQGERVFLYGPSGSGKSTLLALLGGVVVPQQGTVRVLGTDLTAMRPASRDRFRVDHIGFIFQQFNLLPYLSVLDNVLLPCRFSHRRRENAAGDGRSMREEAARLLEQLDVEQALWSKPIAQLSVGQQQRVAAARALIGQPQLIIADEPTSSLDAERQNAFLDLLLRECAEARSTLFFVSHDRRLAHAFHREVSLPSISRAPAEVSPA